MKEKKEKPINYDFHDPVLNKEFVESITKKNQRSYRMKNDPSYKTRVMAQMKNFYAENSQERVGIQTVRNSTAERRLESFDFCNNEMFGRTPNSRSRPKPS